MQTQSSQKCSKSSQDSALLIIGALATMEDCLKADMDLSGGCEKRKLRHIHSELLGMKAGQP